MGEGVGRRRYREADRRVDDSGRLAREPELADIVAVQSGTDVEPGSAAVARLANADAGRVEHLRVVRIQVEAPLREVASERIPMRSAVDTLHVAPSDFA